MQYSVVRLPTGRFGIHNARTGNVQVCTRPQGRKYAQLAVRTLNARVQVKEAE